MREPTLADPSSKDTSYAQGATPANTGVSRRPRMVGSLLWLFSAHLATLVVGFATAIAISHVGAGELGRYRLAQAVLMYLLVISDAGLSTLAVREIARDHARAGDYSGPVLYIRALIAVAILAGVVPAMLVLPIDRTAVPFYAVMFLGVVPAALSLTHALQGLERLRLFAVARLLAVPMPAVVGLGAYLATHSLVLLALPPLVLGLVVDVWLIWTASRKWGIGIRLPRTAQWRGFLRAGFPFLLGTLAIQLISNADAIIIGAVRGESQLGVYAAAYVLAGQFLFLSGPLSWAVFPRLAALHGRGSQFVHALSALSGAIGFFAVPICIAVALLADQVVALLYGRSYEASAPVLAVLMGMPLLGFYNVGIGQALNASGRPGTVAKVAWVAAVTSVVLNIWLVPVIGIQGSAAVAVVTECVTAVVYTGIALPLAGVAPLVRYFAALPHALAMGAVLVAGRLIGLPLLVLILLGFATYAGAAALRPPEALRSLRSLMLGSA